MSSCLQISSSASMRCRTDLLAPSSPGIGACFFVYSISSFPAKMSAVEGNQLMALAKLVPPDVVLQIEAAISTALSSYSHSHTPVILLAGASDDKHPGALADVRNALGLVQLLRVKQLLDVERREAWIVSKHSALVKVRHDRP